MEANGIEFAEAFEWPTLSSVEKIVQVDNEPVVFLPRSWSRTMTKLPARWAVTSDSLALALAMELAKLNGDWKLILMKSADPALPPESNGQWPLVGLAEQGYVDAFFPTLCERPDSVPVELINLRRSKMASDRLP